MILIFDINKYGMLVSMLNDFWNNIMYIIVLE